MDRGFITIHRKIEDSQVFNSPELLKVWMWCLLNASHKDHWVRMKTGKGHTEVELKRGQLIFGRKTVAKKLKMKPTPLYDRVKKLQAMDNITLKSGTHWSIITVCNYDLYQSPGNPTRQAPDTQPTPNRQATDTYNKGNNVNNENKGITDPLIAGLDHPPGDRGVPKRKRGVLTQEFQAFQRIYEVHVGMDKSKGNPNSLMLAFKDRKRLVPPKIMQERVEQWSKTKQFSRNDGEDFRPSILTFLTNPRYIESPPNSTSKFMVDKDYRKGPDDE